MISLRDYTWIPRGICYENYIFYNLRYAERTYINVNKLKYLESTALHTVSDVENSIIINCT